jgi:hypothetical protein
LWLAIGAVPKQLWMAGIMPISQELVQKTKYTWQKYTPNNFGQEECRQVIENAAGFFGILAEWQAKVENKSDRLPKDKSSAAT